MQLAINAMTRERHMSHLTLWRRMGHAALLTLFIATPGSAQRAASSAGPSRYLYVWAGTGGDTTRGIDMMTVIDADPKSSSYGTVRAALTVDTAGKMPHHTEFTAPRSGVLAANDFSSDKSYLIDFSTPEKPRLAGRLDRVPGGRQLHSFERLANGHLLATVQFSTGSDAGHPGALAEFDEHGKLLRTGWSRDAAFPGAHIRTYALAVVKSADRIVTTSSPMDNETTANVVQVWRLSDLTLLKTLEVPATPGDSAHRYPFEVRALADGSVMLNTYYCGFYHVTGLAASPSIARVLALPRNSGCSVPVILGRYMVMPIAYAHRYATIDIADPNHPREVASFATDSTFFPHWASVDPGTDRIVVTDQGDGAPMVKIMHLDRSTGRLSWDERFRDRGAASPGVSYHRASFPNGVTGMAMPHGAVFVR
jgi:hypothetical protein